MKPEHHQLQSVVTVGTAGPTPPAAQQSGFDPTTILLLALFLAIVGTAFWKVLIKAAIVVGLALVFAGILVPVMWMTSH